MSTEQLESNKPGLIDFLGQVPDPRMERTRGHKLIDILVIGVCCLICGGEGFTDMETFGRAQYKWLRTILELPNGIPSHDTFNRVFSAIDPDRCMECFTSWVQSLRPLLDGEIVAVDGKALRHAYDSDASIPYIVSAWATGGGLTLGQVKVQDKSNEITAIPKLLRILELSGCIVTIDAMGCQKKIAREIIAADADYVLALKGNQTVAHKEIRAFFDDVVPMDKDKVMAKAVVPQGFGYHETIEGDHGRIETRRYWVTDQIDWFQDKSKWEGLQAFGFVDSYRQIGEERSYERRSFLLSITPQAERFAHACRAHWGVENPLHWTLDVTFKEDASRARSGYAAQNLAALRRLAHNTIKADKSKPKLSVRSKRLMAGWNQEYLAHLLGTI